MSGSPSEKANNPIAGVTIEAAASLIMPAPSIPGYRDWVRDNMLTTREAVQNGRHDICYYPASGRDGVRVLIAYDVSHLVLVDSNAESFETTVDDLTTIGVENLEVTEADDRRLLSFDLDGRRRIITEVTGDARLETPATLGLGLVDIYHIYLPTGADQDITEDEVYFKERYGDSWRQKTHGTEAQATFEQDPDAPKPDPETGKYRVAVKAMPGTLTPDNYQMIQEGGFFALSERSTRLSPIVLEIAGLKEIPIVRRHPSTVLTSFHPSAEEIETMDHTGILIQKVTVVDPEVIAISNDENNIQFSMDGFAAGQLYYLGIYDTEKTTVEAIQDRYQEFAEHVKSQASRYTNAGVAAELVVRYEALTEQEYKDAVRQLQSNLAEMREVLDTQFDNDGNLLGTNEDVLAALDIHRNSRTDRLDNGRFPLALQYALLDAKDMSSGNLYREVVDEIIAADFSFLR